MDRDAVLKQFTDVLDDFINQSAYGEILVKIRGGVPMLLSTTTQRELQPKGAPHGKPEYRSTR